MNPLLLPWITRGLKYDTREYLASVSLEPGHSGPEERDAYLIHPEMPMNEALPLLVDLRGSTGDIEYGCFELNGYLIRDPDLRINRQRRNILYYTIRDLANISRGQNRFGEGALIDLVDDPVPVSPDGNWAVLLSTECPNRHEVESALHPLVEHRSGRFLEMPKLLPGEFQHWLADQFNNRQLPPYLLICDSFENIHLEYQYIFNAFAVTGRLWFDEPAGYDAYVQKVLAVERGEVGAGDAAIVACPVDDDVTFADNKSIISPMLKSREAQSLELKALRGQDFNKDSLLESGRNARFMALYCHGIGLPTEELAKRPTLQGAFVLRYGAEEDEGLLTPNDIASKPFVSGGIVFSPACLAGGTQGDSDFAAWLDPQGLPLYTGEHSRVSSIGQALLASASGPMAALVHFDISISSSAPMFNPLTGEHDLQKEIHTRFIRLLSEGETLGRATGPFRWAAGTYYAQAITQFEKVAGTRPFMSWDPTTIGKQVYSLNQYHVVATDMRNYIILGDPAVRLPQ